MAKQPCVYILTSRPNGTLYVGSTTNLLQRVWQHKNGVIPGFTAEHGVTRLVWYEVHETIDTMATREKAIKRWRRPWKIRLIEQLNPKWKDLYEELT